MNLTPYQIEGKDISTGHPIRISINSQGFIEQVDKLSLTAEAIASHDWIAPGLVDLQINGVHGIDFNTPELTVEDIRQATSHLWLQGITMFCPTVITNSDDSIEKIMKTIAEACAQYPMIDNSIAGIHLEGPFISLEDGARGAHGKPYVKAPDWDLLQRWQQAAGGRIRIVTMSPEWDNAASFIAACVRNNIIVSIGHTAAQSHQIEAAVEAGATMSTHLGNGAHPILPRHPNYIWDQLSQDKLWPCVIADGFHLPIEVLNVFMKVKQEQMMLVSDAVYLCGLPSGEYETHIGGRVMLTDEGKLHMVNEPELLAGSAQLLLHGIEHLMRSGLCALDAAWGMASIRPASFLNLAVSKGIQSHTPADLVKFKQMENKIIIQEVMKNGIRMQGSQDIDRCFQIF